VTNTSITPKIYQPFDIHGSFTTKITFNLITTNFRAQFLQLILRKVFDLLGGSNSGNGADLASARATDTVNLGQSDHGVFVIGNIYSGYACHKFNPSCTSGCTSLIDFSITAKLILGVVYVEDPYK
jgi:hypothetical protein